MQVSNVAAFAITLTFTPHAIASRNQKYSERGIFSQESLRAVSS